MITIIEGLTGHGKTNFMTRLLQKEWNQNQKIFANYKLYFSEENEEIFRWHELPEIFHLRKGIIAMDEVQDLAGHWMSMPASFRSKLSHHRHQELDIYATTQAFQDLHVEFRRNTHEIYRAISIFRMPRRETKKPILQIIRVIKKRRVITNDQDAIKFGIVPTGFFRTGKLLFISKYWTKKTYDTFANIDFDRYICKLICERTKKSQKKPTWILKIYNRDMVTTGRARL